MSLPPIITHVSRVLPPMLLKAAVAYFSMWLIWNRSTSSTGMRIPVWLLVILSVLFIPDISRLQAIAKEHKYKRDAVANAALPVPTLPLSSWQAAKALRKSFATSPTPSKPSLRFVAGPDVCSHRTAVDVQKGWVAAHGNTFRIPTLGSDIMVDSITARSYIVLRLMPNLRSSLSNPRTSRFAYEPQLRLEYHTDLRHRPS